MCVYQLSCRLTLYLCVCFHKYIPFLWISIHTSSPSVHNSIIPLIMLQPQKWYLLFLSPHHFYQPPSSSNSSAHTLPVQWWMCTAAACGQWNSTVYTYHIHLINPNEVSTGLLFTMHCWAAAARHGATTHTHSDTHAHRQRCHQQCQQSHSASGRKRSSLFSWCWSHSALRSQTDRPMGFNLIEGGGNYSFHSLHRFALPQCTAGASTWVTYSTVRITAFLIFAIFSN